ncbi:cation:proton antiporter [Muribaculum intestinale]|uniref:cation:proton antiporter n=2 Tax=Muribaculum intestinale TaxID=1796646 RepID=UPI001F355163|nr:cation:proton antiporter [Muribaculum intestinale]
MLLNLIMAAATGDVASGGGEMSDIQVESLVRDLAFILLMGAVVTVLFKWLKQPVVLGYIVAGFLASPHFHYLPSVTTESNIEFWAQLGIVVLLFSLGLEFSFKKLLNTGGSAVVTAMIIVIGMMCTGFAIGHLLNFSHMNSLFLGGMLSMSSTTIIIKAFTDLGLRQKKFASLVFAVLIVEDLFAVLMMVVLSSIAINNSVEGSELLMSVAKLVFFLIIWFLVGVYVLPSALNRIRRYLNSETLLIIALGLCFGMAVFSVYCGFSLALGAFVMGSIIAGMSYAESIEAVVSPVKDLFGAVFFISVGMMVDLNVIVEYFWPILLLSGVVIAGMILFGTFGMLITGQSLRIAMESGFSLTQIGEFAFIIASLGMSLGVLDPTIYPIVVAVSVLTTFTTPYFIRMADPVYGFVERHLPKRMHFLIERYSENANSESETRVLWASVLKRYVWRILLYSSVVIAIMLLCLKYVEPLLLEFSPSWGRFITSVITLLLMAPFLLALAMPASRKTERERLVAANAHFDVPLIVMTIFRLLLALGFIIYAISAIHSMRIGWIVGLLIFVVMLCTFSGRLRKRLQHMEMRFFDNLNERELRRSGKNNNLVSDMHLAFITVGYGCPFVGDRLMDSNLRKKYGVNVASIQRGGHTLLVPNGAMRIFPGDTLGIIGTDDQIESILPVIERIDDSEPDTPAMADVKLTKVQLSVTSELIGKTSATGQLRDKYKVLLVAIQRPDGTYMHPDGTTLFEAEDVLWIVGPSESVEKMK